MRLDIWRKFVPKFMVFEKALWIRFYHPYEKRERKWGITRWERRREWKGRGFCNWPWEMRGKRDGDNEELVMYIIRWIWESLEYNFNSLCYLTLTTSEKVTSTISSSWKKTYFISSSIQSSPPYSILIANF